MITISLNELTVPMPAMLHAMAALVPDVTYKGFQPGGTVGNTTKARAAWTTTS